MSAVITADSPDSPPARPAKRRPLLPSAVLGMLIFVVTEAMLFAGMVSAYQIVRSRAPEGFWPPPAQPRLPIWETAINSGFLLASGVVLFFANRAFEKDRAQAAKLLLVSLILGAAFVGLQGSEWVALISEGLTITTSAHAGFFYLIVGAHGLHATAALLYMFSVWRQLRTDTLDPTRFYAAQVLWFFVVGLWPFLYARVYLS